MKRFIFMILLLPLFFGMQSCNKVPAGNVGVKVFLLGGEKGVDSETLGPGRYWIGWNEELFLFPTFTQTYTWTHDTNEGSPTDQSISFQTQEGMTVNADVGISYHIVESKVASVFQKYRKGVEEITHTFLRNVVRNTLNEIASSQKIDFVYGQGKSTFLNQVEEKVRSEVGPIGIEVEYISFIGSLRLPVSVERALNSKMEATQRAEQRENELREAEAEARKKVAQADGEAQSNLSLAKAAAQAELIRAEATAKANEKIAKSLTRELVEYQKINKWDGKLSQVTGGGTPFLTLK